MGYFRWPPGDMLPKNPTYLKPQVYLVHICCFTCGPLQAQSFLCIPDKIRQSNNWIKTKLKFYFTTMCPHQLKKKIQILALVSQTYWFNVLKIKHLPLADLEKGNKYDTVFILLLAGQNEHADLINREHTLGVFSPSVCLSGLFFCLPAVSICVNPFLLYSAQACDLHSKKSWSELRDAAVRAVAQLLAAVFTEEATL